VEQCFLFLNTIFIKASPGLHANHSLFVHVDEQRCRMCHDGADSFVHGGRTGSASAPLGLKPPFFV